MDTLALTRQRMRTRQMTTRFPKEKTPSGAMIFVQQLVACAVVFLVIWGMKQSSVEIFNQGLGKLSAYLSKEVSVEQIFHKMEAGVSFGVGIYQKYGKDLFAKEPQTAMVLAPTATPQPSVKPSATPVVKETQKATPQAVPKASPKPPESQKPQSLNFLPPMPGTLSSKFGMRFHPIYKKDLFHYGIDIVAPLGQEIYAAEGGKVVGVGSEKILGNYVKLSHKDGYETVYGHMQGYLVKKNEVVKKGQKIGKMGDSGLSVGAHLHFEIRKDQKAVDPQLFVKGY